MASPNETKFPEQQISHSDSATLPTPMTGEFATAEIAENQVQHEDEVAVLTPMADASGTANNRPDQEVHGESNPAAPDTVGETQTGAVSPQQQNPTQVATVVPATATTADDVVVDDADDDGEVEDGEAEDDLDDKIFVEPEPKSQIGEVVYSEELNLYHAQLLREKRIFHDLRNFDISEANASDDEDDDIAEAIRTSLADQAIPNQAVSLAGGESAHSDGEGSGPVFGAAADSDHEHEEHDNPVAATPAGSDNSNGKNRDSAAAASTGPDDGSTKGSSSMIPASADGDGENADGGSSETTAPAGVDHVDEGNSDSGSSDVASEEDEPGPSREDKGKMKEVRDEEVPEDSGAPREATPSTCNPMDRVSTLTGHQRPQMWASSVEEEEEEEEGHTADALRNHDDSEGIADTADTGLGANTDHNTESHSGESPNDTGSGESDHGASQDLLVKTGAKDSDTVHLKIEYLVRYSTRAKATICISVPATITYAALERTISNTLRHHGGFENPHPIHKEAKISRLVAVFAKKRSGEAGFCRTRELTDGNLEETLRRMLKGSIYDVVKVQFKPGTNGKVEHRKATGKVYGKSRKVGRL